ncbi:MAG: type II secretion system protein [bacterium]|nr:type II secretion system protein [bacterium]
MSLPTTNYQLQTRKGFTLVEFLVVIALIGILVTLTVFALRDARRKTRDAERVSAVNQVRVGLALGFIQLAQYPVQTEGDLRLGDPGTLVLCEVSGVPQFVAAETQCTGTVFLNPVPAAPTPDDGACNALQNTYRYLPGSGNTSYQVEFCMGKATAQSGLANGLNCVTNTGVKAGPCAR